MTVQPEHVKEILEHVSELNGESSFNVSIKDILYAFQIAEYSRRSNLMIWDGETKDEQLAGFGTLLELLILEVQRLNSNLESR